MLNDVVDVCRLPPQEKGKFVDMTFEHFAHDKDGSELASALTLALISGQENSRVEVSNSYLKA